MSEIIEHTQSLFFALYTHKKLQKVPIEGSASREKCQLEEVSLGESVIWVMCQFGNWLKKNIKDFSRVVTG